MPPPSPPSPEKVTPIVLYLLRRRDKNYFMETFFGFKVREDNNDIIILANLASFVKWQVLAVCMLAMCYAFGLQSNKLFGKYRSASLWKLVESKWNTSPNQKIHTKEWHCLSSICIKHTRIERQSIMYIMRHLLILFCLYFGVSIFD